MWNPDSKTFLDSLILGRIPANKMSSEFPHEIVITFPQLSFSWVWCNFKAFYPFKDFSIWPNTEKLKPKILCSLGTHECRFEFDLTWGKDPRLKESFSNNSDVIVTLIEANFHLYVILTAVVVKSRSAKQCQNPCSGPPPCVPGFEYSPWLTC